MISREDYVFSFFIFAFWKLIHNFPWALFKLTFHLLFAHPLPPFDGVYFWYCYRLLIYFVVFHHGPKFGIDIGRKNAGKMPEKSREFAGNRALNLLWQRDYVRLHSEKQQFSVFVWFDRNFAFKCFLGDFHYNIEYLKIKKFHAHTVSNDGTFVAVTVQIVCSVSYAQTLLFFSFLLMQIVMGEM